MPSVSTSNANNAHFSRSTWKPPGASRCLRAGQVWKRSCISPESARTRGRPLLTSVAAVVEHQHLIGPALPFPNQPGSRLQFGTRTPPDLSGFVELLCDLLKLALPLRA